jgi:hypothetical protein
MPVVPVSVWDQLAIVVIFAFLLAGIGWLIIKVFSKAIADINKYYAAIVESNNTQFSKALLENNKQWQLYFDARSESNKIIESQMVEKLESLTDVIVKLDSRFGQHDLMERQALDEMSGKRKLTKKINPN